MKPKILIIEDVKGIAENVSYALMQNGLRLSWVTTGKEGMEEIQPVFG